MTTIVPELVKCAICGKGNQVMMVQSATRSGACDLDTRHSELFHFAISLQRCKHCGYVSTKISVGDDSIREFLESSMYKTCDGINPESPDARDFIQYALLQSYMKIHKGLFNPIEDDEDDFSHKNIFKGFLNAAWVCDDVVENESDENKYDRELCRRNAIACRKRCLDLINTLIVHEEDQDKRETLSEIKADLLRRTGDFDAVIAEFENKVFTNPYVDQIVRFEIDLARFRDAKKYTTDQIDQVRYPLKERSKQ